MNWRSCGMSFVKIQVNRRIRPDKVRLLLERKLKIVEERNYESNKDVVRISYVEEDPKLWGGTAPTICLEYDEKNNFLFQITIQYNRRSARKDSILSVQQLKDKVMQELDHQCIFREEQVENALAMKKKKIHVENAIAMKKSETPVDEQE